MTTCTNTADSGMTTLAAQGLDLMALDDDSAVELLKWHKAERCKPDADTTVLLWIADRDGLGSGEWEAGWFDGDDWRLCESGGVCGGTVVAWAEPAGPAA